MEIFSTIISNVIGNIGVVCFLLAYFLLQNGKILHTSFAYLSLNLAGSLLVLFSLMINWNLPAFLLETAWAFISAWGLYQNVYLPNRKKK